MSVRLPVTAALAALLLLLCGQAAGQVPGYRGKRLSIAATLDFFPAGRESFVNDYPNFHLNTRPGLEIDYVCSRRTSLGFGFDVFQTGAAGYNARLRKREHYRISGSGLTLYAKVFPFFSMGNIAPVGMYWQWSFGASVSTYDLARDGEVQFESLGTAIVPLAGLGLGHQAVIKHIVLVDYGLNTFFAAGGLSGGTEGKHGNIVNTRNRGFWGFALKIGVGVLI